MTSVCPEVREILFFLKMYAKDFVKNFPTKLLANSVFGDLF